MRNRGVDILRAVAVLLVLGRHGGGPRVWNNVGWIGVDLFFVLSGFLISGLLYSEYKKTGGINWKRFFIRRGFKIYPAFYAMIFITPLWSIVSHHQIRWRAMLPEVLFYQSYQPNRVWAHTWSLAVEEHFYILLPALLLTMLYFQKKNGRDPFRLVPLVCAGFGALCLLGRAYLAYTSPRVGDWWQYIQFPTHLRIDSLLFGVFLGYLYHFHGERLKNFRAGRWPGLFLIACSSLLISTCFVFSLDSPFMLSFGLTALYLGFGGILILVVCGGSEAGTEGKVSQKSWLGSALAYIGMYSYSIYLWHPMVSQHVRDLEMRIWPGIPNFAVFWSYALSSLVVGILLSRLIEYPALHLRDRLFPSIQQPVKGS